MRSCAKKYHANISRNCKWRFQLAVRTVRMNIFISRTMHIYWWKTLNIGLLVCRLSNSAIDSIISMDSAASTVSLCFFGIVLFSPLENASSSCPSNCVKYSLQWPASLFVWNWQTRHKLKSIDGLFVSSVGRSITRSNYLKELYSLL